VRKYWEIISSEGAADGGDDTGRFDGTDVGAVGSGRESVGGVLVEAKVDDTGEERADLPWTSPRGISAARNDSGNTG